MRDRRGHYLGRYQRGQAVTLGVRVLGPDRLPAMPDSAPTARVYGDGGLVATYRLPIIDKGGQVGMFQRPVAIGLEYERGRYRVVYQYAVGAHAGMVIDTFEVIPGGDSGGAVISMYAYDRPEARYVVAQLSDGKLVQGRNPRL
ncbi:MAG: hypothetical protein IRY99_07945 [Isosphaeraceae bacterium]|nr:hypothetical protein [Isosphaeraceae bacterium]